MAQTILLDTTPGYMQPILYYSEGDVGRTFDINLQSRFGDSLPESPTVTIQATKPSGLGFSVAADSITNGVATFTLTATMSNESGRFPAELKIVKDDVTLYTAKFMIQSDALAHPDGTTDGDASTLIPTLTLLVQRVETAASNILDMTVVAETLPAGSDATYSYDEETNTATFGIPRGADGSVTSVAGKTGDVTLDADDVAYDSTDTYTDGTVGAELTDLKADITEGTMEDLAVGSLLSNSKISDNAPYLFRQTGNGKSGVGSRLWLDKVIGGTVAYNQLVQNGNFEDTSNWIKVAGVDSISATSNILTATITGGSVLPSYSYAVYQTLSALSVSHKYLITIDVNSSISSDFAFELGGGQRKISDIYTADAWNTFSTVCVPSTYNYQFYIYPFSAVGDVSAQAMTIKYRNAMCIDLTQMFGSTIADYAYSLEQSTSGSGIAWLKNYGFFTEDYYEYNTGELKSVEGVSAHVTYDADSTEIGNYALDSDLTLCGIPKLDASNNLYYDGDEYAYDGTVTRKYGIVTFDGTENWAYSSSSGAMYLTEPSDFTYKKPCSALSSKYQYFGQGSMSSDVLGDKSYGFGMAGSGVSIYEVWIKDINYTDVTAFKDYLANNPLTIVYELATPMTDTADTYQQIQICDDSGTEEFVSTSIVPVGTESRYNIDLVGKLEDMPTIPSAPTTDGTYSLQLVVSDGEATAIWT